MTVANDPITPAAGAEVVETPVEATPEATTAQPVMTPEEEAARDSWAIGRAMELRPDLFQKQEQPKPAYDATPGHPDVPKHPKHDQWEAEGNTEAIENHIAAVKAARLSMASVNGESQEKLERIERTMARNSCISGAVSLVPVGARAFIDKAVQDIEKDNGGPIPADHPLMRKMIAEKAELMFIRSGGDKKPVGETVGASSQHSTGIPQALKDEWLPLLKQTGYPTSSPDGILTDAELAEALKEMKVRY